MSVDARSIIDFKVGICFTRLFSTEILKNIKKYNKEGFKKRIMSYGPCQTPTLWFCVRRLKQLKEHKNNSYYRIFVEIKDDEGNMHRLYLDKKFNNKKELLKKLNKIRFNFFVGLEKISISKKKIESPKGLKTTSMLKMASLQLGLSPYEASREAQHLYMAGLISYPRTKSTKYNENYDFKSSLMMFKKNRHFSQRVNELLNNFDYKSFNYSKGEAKGGHEPIVPTLSRTEDNIRKNLNWDLYKCICLYYFASISPPLEYINKKYEFTLGKYKLKKTVSKLTKKGFLDFMPFKKITFSEKFPLFEENKKYKIENIDFEQFIDEKLKCLTESDLIDKMEKKHIGTDGSIPSHIKNLMSRGYVRVNENRRIIPTKLGVSFIDSLKAIVPEIVKPENRADIEEKVKEIEFGEKNFKEAIKDALDFYKQKLFYCSYKIDKIKDEFRKYFEFI